MNYYGFAHPIRAFLAGQDIAYHPIKISATELDHWLKLARAHIPFKNQLAQFNLLDSHDTARFLHLLGEDKQRMRLAATLLITYIGVPSIYYGDEVGLSGGNDPDCRRCFPWDTTDWDHVLHDHYRRLIQLRHPDASCDKVVVQDSPSEVTVQYTCRGRGYGRTHIRKETNRLVQIDSQGIANGLPFEFNAEARRVGDCGA